jgi:uncharacterized protein YqeY
MGLQERLMPDLKDAMKAKDATALEALRAIKAAILVAKTESGAKEELSEDQEIKLLQKLVKQRKDSAELYFQQNREDLAKPELDQVAVIERYLPEQLSVEEIRSEISSIVTGLGATSMKDMGKVMGIAGKKLGAKAEGKVIAQVVKEILGS